MRLFLKSSVLLCLFFWQTFTFAKMDGGKDYFPYPQPDSGYVSDVADLLTYEEEERIEQWLWQVESISKVEIIVVIIDSIADYPGTENASIETFATALFDTYGIGNLTANDGVLFLVAKNDHQARIELGAGYGHSRDLDANRIMDEEIIPQFKAGNYADGINIGTKAIIAEFAGLGIGFPWHLVFVSCAAVAFLLVGISLILNGKKGWGWVFVGLAIVLILYALFLLSRLGKGQSGGWSSGGLGGFGGGFSGGGGATGGW